MELVHPDDYKRLCPAVCEVSAAAFRFAPRLASVALTGIAMARFYAVPRSTDLGQYRE